MKEFVDGAFAQYLVLVAAVLAGIMAIKALAASLLNTPAAVIAKPVLRFG